MLVLDVGSRGGATGSGAAATGEQVLGSVWEGRVDPTPAAGLAFLAPAPTPSGPTWQMREQDSACHTTAPGRGAI